MSVDTSKDLRNLFIYQVYVRNYSQEGTFNSLKNDLKRIKDLGVDIVYLLPIHPIGEMNRKGTLGSPYSIRDYYGINPKLGKLDDFKSLIQEIHHLDMKIMMDIVFNHTAFDSVLVKEHPGFFFKKNGEFANKVGDWWDITDLDFNTGKPLWDYLIKVLLYWTDLGVDAYRFDVASLLPLSFLKSMKEAALKKNPKTIFLSESVHGGFCKYLRDQGFNCLSESEIYQVFDMAYDYDLSPYLEGYLRGDLPFKRYLEELIRQEEVYPENYVKLRNLENHDYGRFISLVDNNIDKVKQWTALNFFSRGASMIYNGQENNDPHLPSLFDKDKVRWDGTDISNFIKKLNEITNVNTSSHGIYDIDLFIEKDVYIGKYTYQGQSLVGIFNVGLENGEVQVPLENGSYLNLINGKEIIVHQKQIALSNEPIIVGVE